MFIGKSGLEKLLIGEHKNERDKILSNEISWNALWNDFYKKALRWNQKKIFDVFGSNKPVETGLQTNFPETHNDRHRLLYGEFLRQYHERLAFDITYFGFPGSENKNLFKNIDKNVCDRNIKDMIGIVARSHRMNLRNHDLEEYIRNHPYNPIDYDIPIY